MKPIAILGAGSWGTALGLYLSRRGQIVHLWSVQTHEIAEVLLDKENKRYLPGHALPSNLVPHAELAHALKEIQDVLIVVPSVGFRGTLKKIAPLLSTDARLISATKGIDPHSGQFMHEVAADVFGDTLPFAALSGPSFAKEIAAGLPCSVMIASTHSLFINDLIQRFHSPVFHVYPSEDVTGVEIGGVVKNIIAIGTGFLDGMQLGANARAALITRGLSEIIQLGQALGGKVETMIGLAGLGDLILTCSEDQSRNRRFGLALGCGKSPAEALEEIGQTVEGTLNATQVIQLAKRLQIHLPLCETINQLLQGKLTAEEAIQQMI